MNGSTFPGRMISWAGTVCFGEITDTAVIATCEVSVRNALPAPIRDQMPHARRVAVTISAIARINQLLCATVLFPKSVDGPESPPMALPTSIWCDIVAPLQSVAYCLLPVAHVPP